jgi:hypothetical protein
MSQSRINTYVANSVEVLKDLLVDFQENNFLGDVSVVNGWRGSSGSGSDDEHDLLFNLVSV